MVDLFKPHGYIVAINLVSKETTNAYSFPSSISTPYGSQTARVDCDQRFNFTETRAKHGFFFNYSTERAS
ncbi:hypothetical protein ALT1644_310024 [Alteromonas macleodii]